MKLKQFQSYLKEKNIDYVLLLNNPINIDPNFVYFTQITNIIASLIISPSNSFLITPSIELEIAKKYSRIKKIYKPNKDLLKFLKSKIKKAKKIGVNEEYITISFFKKLKKTFPRTRFVDISDILIKLRQIKTKEEIDYLKKSAKLADIIMEKAINHCNQNKTEIEVKNFIEKQIKELNCLPSFSCIVASGKNSANPHHIPENKKLRGFVVIDLGVKYRNYCSDMTRTIYIGKPSEKEVKIYNKILKLQQECIDSNELNAVKLYKKAQKVLGKNFIHSLGHGVGIQVHESPSLKPKSEDILENNMVFTIEPGFYSKTFGIRIEDMILVNNKKFEMLTKTSKKMVILN